MIKKNNEEYYSNQHSKFLLQYHLVLITKYRHKVIDGKLKDSLVNYTKKYFEDRDINIIEFNIDGDYIHILFECYPNMNLASFVNAFKSASSRRMRTDFDDYLKPFYWKPYFWSKSYFICTVSENNLILVKQYIEDQGIR